MKYKYKIINEYLYMTEILTKINEKTKKIEEINNQIEIEDQ